MINWKEEYYQQDKNTYDFTGSLGYLEPDNMTVVEKEKINEETFKISKDDFEAAIRKTARELGYKTEDGYYYKKGDS